MGERVREKRMIKLYEERKHKLKENKNQWKQSSNIKIHRLLCVNQVGQKGGRWDNWNKIIKEINHEGDMIDH